MFFDFSKKCLGTELVPASEIERVLGERGLNVAVLRLGLPDRFVDHGEQGQLLAELGLDKEGIVRSVRERLTQPNQTESRQNSRP